MLPNINWMKWIPNIITAVVMAVMGFQLQHYKTKYNAVSIEYRYFKQEQSRLVALEKQKQLTAKKDFEQVLADQAAQSKQAYDLLANQFKKVVNSDANKQLVIDDLNDLTRQLRQSLSASLSASANVAGHTRRDPEGGRECDGAIAKKYEILTLAATKTTLDYNRCRLWMDEACSIVKCE